MSRHDDPPAGDRARSPIVPYAAVRVRTDVPRAVLQLPAGAPGRVPGRRGRPSLPAPLPARRARRAAARHRRRDQPAASSSSAATAASSRARSSARTAWSTRTTATCAAATARSRIQVDALGDFTAASCAAREPAAGQPAPALARPRPPAGRPGGARRGDRRRHCPGAFVAMDPRNGEVLAMGSCPSFDPTSVRQAAHADASTTR